MNILVSTNELYLKPLVVMLSSLESQTNEQQINVFFLNVTVPRKKLKWLSRKLSRFPKITLRTIDISQEEFEGLSVSQHFSIETYSRLFLIKVLPPEISRILWLDADIVIHNNIDSFYNINCDGHSLVSCESINQNIGSQRETLGLSDNQKYFNAGIVLFNLEYLRTHFTSEDLINYAIQNKDLLKWYDQDVLNATCGSSALIIDYFKYNYMHFTNSSISDEEYQKLIIENCILHYIGPVKPWHTPYRCPTYTFWCEAAKKAKVYSFFFFLKHDLYSSSSFVKALIEKAHRLFER